MLKLNIQLFAGNPIENYDNKDKEGNVKIETPSGVTYYFPESLFKDVRENKNSAGDELLPALIYAAYNFEYGESVFETLNRQSTALGIPNGVNGVDVLLLNEYIQNEVERRGGTVPSIYPSELQRWFVKEYMLPEFAKTLGYDEHHPVYQRIKNLNYDDKSILDDLTNNSKGYQKNINSVLSGSNAMKTDPKSGEELTFSQHYQKYLKNKYVPGLGFPVFKGNDGTLYYELQGALVDKDGKATQTLTGVMLVNGKEPEDAKEITITRNELPFFPVTGKIIPNFVGHDIDWNPKYSGSDNLQNLLTRNSGGEAALKNGLITVHGTGTYVYSEEKKKWGKINSFSKIETPETPVYAEGDLDKAVRAQYEKYHGDEDPPVTNSRVTYEGIIYVYDKDGRWENKGPDPYATTLDPLPAGTGGTGGTGGTEGTGGTYNTYGDAKGDTTDNKEEKDPISFAYDDHFNNKNKYYEDIFSLNEGTLGARMLQNNEDLLTKEANNALVASQTAMQTQGLAQAQALKQITDSIRAERMAQLKAGMSEAQLAEREIQMLMAGNKQMTDNLYQANQGMFEAQLAGETAKEQAFNQYIEQATALGQVTAGHHAAAAGDLIEQAKQLQVDHYNQNGEQISLGAALDKVVAAKKDSPMNNAF